MAVAQQALDLMLGDITRLARSCGHHDPAQPLLPQQFFLDSCQRREDHVILVLSAARADSLGCEHAHHLERQGADAKGLSDGIAGAEQVFPHGVTQHRHSRRLGYILVAKRCTTGKRPVAHFEVLRLGSHDLSGPILVAEYDLLTRLYTRRRRRDRWALARNSSSV